MRVKTEELAEKKLHVLKKTSPAVHKAGDRDREGKRDRVEAAARRWSMRVALRCCIGPRR